MLKAPLLCVLLICTSLLTDPEKLLISLVSLYFSLSRMSYTGSHIVNSLFIDFFYLVVYIQVSSIFVDLDTSSKRLKDIAQWQGYLHI